MPSKADKTKLGLFLVVAVAVAVGMAAAFIGFRALKESAEYYVFAQDVEGVEVGTPVKVRGVRVGEVAALDLTEEDGSDSEGVRVTLEVDGDVRLAADSEAYFEMAGVSGLKLVNIRGGTPGTGVLEPGSTLPYGRTTLEKLSEKSDDIIERLSGMFDRASEVIDHVSLIAHAIEPSEVQAMAADLAEAAKELRAITKETRGPMRQTIADTRQVLERVDRVGARAEELLTEVDGTVNELRGTVRTNGDELRAAMDNLKQASQSFKMLGRDLRRKPSALLFGGSPKERELP